MKKHAIDLIADGTPWAITREALDQILTIARRENNLEAVLKERGAPLDNTYTVEVRDGVALLPVNGPLFPRANLFMQVSGAASVEMLAQDLAAAAADPGVRAVVMMVDSPGGRTTMINEFANQIKAFPKPVVAYVVGQASSAAYWLAAATDKIVIDGAALAGSIGTVLSMEKRGDGSVEIVSSNAPDKRPDVNSEGGRQVLQTLVDDLEAVFIDAVAGFRALNREQITALRGGVLVGAKAVEKGLADEIGSLESVINQLQLENPMDLQKLKADHKEIYQAAFDEGKASIDAAAAKQDAAAAERDRFKTVMAHESYAGREAAANKMLTTTGMSAGEITSVLAEIPKAAAAQPAAGKSAFESRMEKTGNADLGAGNGDDQAGAEEAEARAGWAKAAKPFQTVNGGRR